MTEHVILVAFQMRDGLSREEAMEHLMGMLPPVRTQPHLESWWVAEDDRTDGSDCDSAVFVSPGYQRDASAYLYSAGYTPRCNVLPRNDAGQFPSLPDRPEPVVPTSDELLDELRRRLT